jgi:soluble lytic murein transglycosylase-like protein
MIKKILKMFLMVFKELNNVQNNDIEIPKIIKKKKVIKKIETLNELIIRFSHKMPLKNNKKNLALLKAIIRQESNFKIRATSVSGARGLMQIMNFLGKIFGYKVEDLYNPAINLKIGTSHFSTQYKHFKFIKNKEERTKISLATYNAGRAYISVSINLLKKEKKELTWKNIKSVLKKARYRGKIADIKQVVHYVRKVTMYYKGYLENEENK